jgi:hypothetical protein
VTRAASARWTIVVVALATAFVGMLLGTWMGERNRYPTRLAYCTLNGASDGLTRPCPPRPGTLVIATWGALTTRAVWTGQMWRFDGLVLGQRETSLPPDAWHEIEARP